MDPAESSPPIRRPAPDPFTPPAVTTDRGDLGLVLTGGGARGAYQVGVLRHLARRFSELRIPVLTGVSAGAVNVVHLAQHQGTFAEAVEDLAKLWGALTPEQVFRTDVASLGGLGIRWALRLMSAGRLGGQFAPRSLVDSEPLRQFLESALRPVDGVLPGIEANLRRGVVRAVALGTTSYTTGQSVVWVQGREIETWERPKRRAVQAQLGVEHILASAALPLFFPAVRLGDEWYGDGGMRLTAPLSPALHLGASRLLAIGTRYEATVSEASRPEVRGYPPPAQVLGLLYNAIFLDLIDQDVMRLERLNRVLRPLEPSQRQGLRVVEILVMRPSEDLGRIAHEYEARLPRAFRFLTRGLGTREMRSADLLSLLLFQDDYIQRLIAIGEADAKARESELVDFLAGFEAGVRR